MIFLKDRLQFATVLSTHPHAGMCVYTKHQKAVNKVLLKAN